MLWRVPGPPPALGHSSSGHRAPLHPAPSPPGAARVRMVHACSLSQNTLNSSNSSFPSPLVCTEHQGSAARVCSNPRLLPGLGPPAAGGSGMGAWGHGDTAGSEGGGSLCTRECLKRGHGGGQNLCPLGGTRVATVSPAPSGTTPRSLCLCPWASQGPRGRSVCRAGLHCAKTLSCRQPTCLEGYVH